MFSSIIKNLSILKKFLFINFITFLFIGTLTIIYLKQIAARNFAKTMAAPPVSPGAHSCILRLVPGIATYNVFAIGMLVSDKPPGAHSCRETAC